ncbi:hypothetical protein LVD15_07730 [Fulvivirga maritima]|uniref:SPFH domain-containing protein n=1 Tax=Fulvivirga maritima TaxID=2904247 RepID=UPI001EFF1336|nr:SPFH domain-containing protein [Fulvivirga maritima]UII28307.1 hypothetical protein LVD15_07730 [Fulvivirga maritima]
MAALVVFLIIRKKAAQGQALIKTDKKGVHVSFTELYAVPFIHKFEVMDITLKSLTISLLRHDGITCKDNARADINITFFIRVNDTEIDIIQVAKTIGGKQATDIAQLRVLFENKFTEALRRASKHFEFAELYMSPAAFREKIFDEIGTNFNGYILDDFIIDFLDLTSPADPDYKAETSPN